MQEQAINEAILREREEEIQQINSDVRKVNEIFRDINDIVKDQQQEIDAVESMIEKSHQHAKSGLDQVEKVRVLVARSVLQPTPSPCPSSPLELLPLVNLGKRKQRLYDMLSEISQWAQASLKRPRRIRPSKDKQIENLATYATCATWQRLVKVCGVDVAGCW